MAYASGEQVDGKVYTAERRHVHSLPPHSTSGTDTSRIFTGTSVDDGIDEDLKRVLIGQEVNDLESVLHDLDSEELLAVVPSVHHERVGETLDDGALGLPETLGGVTASSVGQECVVFWLLFDSDIVLEGHVGN